jgi:hypothetical protein
MKIFTSAIVLLLLCSLSTSVLAADITGKWTGQMVLGVAAHTIPFTLDLKLDGSALTGTICAGDCSDGKLQPILNPKIDGENISFDVATDDPGLPKIDFQGTVSGNAIKFVLSGSPPDCDGPVCKVGTGSATRAK